MDDSLNLPSDSLSTCLRHIVVKFSVYSDDKTKASQEEALSLICQFSCGGQDNSPIKKSKNIYIFTARFKITTKTMNKISGHRHPIPNSSVGSILP